MLLVAPTGGGKTLAGFLPSLIELAAQPPRRRQAQLHTLYISPLKALAVDVARNLETPVAEMGLAVRIETRTGDTPPSRRAAPAPFAAGYSADDAGAIRAAAVAAATRAACSTNVRAVVLDELHAMAQYQARRSPVARPRAAGDSLRRIIAASVCRQPSPIPRRCSVISCRSRWTARRRADLVRGAPGAPPEISISCVGSLCAMGGTSGHARDAGCDERDPRLEDRARLRQYAFSQAERTFQELWQLNDENLPIALHHGSLAPEQRRKVEAAMARGDLRARGLHLDARSRHRLGRGRPA